ncbi:hypothetical protein cje16_01156 [Campylobacter jejuni subsp. jejuni 1997-1]|uniref:hypothetical protein n=1 Tax=Campylobacter jejuni TaxID=197 RepID=UPI000258A4E7|nr:hypothetical protein [Campylobacter jejuni]EAI2096370.1 hypothetical protein [Campylobacter jejuni]EAI5537180.1 hypothetical protein [Campylobacter jejuni]EAI7630774.1 hypothetical protein [Campylobacter jejuni]EIB52947.1 hypothetical protein cje16_01156 [Campylobacter jejuni subsp. jejuni 1997-1]MDK2137148.1 hypothetical protein [Campylobacter jejuni]
MIELYGIRETLGVCEEVTEVPEDLKKFADNKNFTHNKIDKYKKIKSLVAKNGIEVFRGFTDVKTIAQISETNKEFQRDIDTDHKNKIIDYVNHSSKSDIYFPEVTLLYSYDVDKNLDELECLKYAIEDLKQINSMETAATMRTFGFAVFKFDIKKDKRLYRLDGNHRIEALLSVAENGENRMISFCILFVPKNEKYSQEHLYFYLLNSKALPVTSNKIFDLVTKADTDELKEFVESDQLLNTLKNTQEAWKDLNEEEKQVLISVINEILNQKFNQNIAKIIIDGIYAYNKHKQKYNVKYGLLGIACYLKYKHYSLENFNEQFKLFNQWIQKFNYNLDNFKKFADLYESFNLYMAMLKRKKHIFVAMEYNKTYIKQYKDSIEKSIHRIQGTNKLHNFKLMEIMNEKQDDNIIEKIFKNIEKSDIVIVDCSTNNNNVLYEYGFAKGLKNKHIILTYNEKWRQKTIDELKNIEHNNEYINKITNNLEQGCFDIKVNKTNKWANPTELEDILEEELKTYIKNNNYDILDDD